MSKLKVIVPVFNAEKYIEKCIVSIMSQTYKDFEMIVLDDCSTDSTPQIIDELNTRYSFRVVHQKVKHYALHNIIVGLNTICTDKEDIIVTVDGDDWLAHDNVFKILNDVYSDANICMTYGQFVPASETYGPYCRPIQNTKTYRHDGDWCVSHLRTFKKKLWDLIKDSDLRGVDGHYYNVAWDASFIYPMVEMCGPHRIKFIESILYVYNDLNQLNDMKLYKERQLATASEIAGKPQYKEITWQTI